MDGDSLDTNTPTDTPAEPTLSPADIAALLDKLGLDPATADVAALLGKVDELIAASGEAAAAQTAVADATGQLAAAQAELERLRGEAEAHFQKLQELERVSAEAAVDAILEQFEARLGDEKMKARIRALLLSDRESAMDILNGLADPESAQPQTPSAPPEPQHDPAADQQGSPSEEQIVEAIKARAKAVFTQNPGSRTDALTQAEKEIRKKVAAREPL